MSFFWLHALVVTAVVGLPLLGESAKPQYTKEGELVLPADYRTWTFVSSGIGMIYDDRAPGNNPPFENVFVNSQAYQNYMKNGVWPDKTILLLEVRGSESKISINKEGRVQAPRIQALEAHVKDNARGGWAFYGFNNGAAKGTPFPKTANCFACHEKNGAVDTTFVQFYPTLVDVAKKKGTYKATE